MIGKIKLEIARLKEEQQPFDYSSEQKEINSLESRIQPLVDRQMKKKPMYDEYEKRIRELEKALIILEEFEEEKELENAKDAE